MGKGVRLDITGSEAVGQGKVEAAEEESGRKKRRMKMIIRTNILHCPDPSIRCIDLLLGSS